MLKRNLWKLVLCLAILAWSVTQLVPIKDEPFVSYARTHATAKPADFAKLLDEATARVKGLQAASEFVALKQIGKERKLDLSQYFPAIRLEDSLRNVEKRNDILLTEILRRSKGHLQLGLDLKGGVAFTLEAKDEPGKVVDAYQRKEKLQKAIEIIGTRINGFGVAEPIIRPIGDNRIEIQLPGISTKDNPDVVDQVKAPARLDFRIVHPFLSPGPGVETPAGYEIKTLDYEGRKGESGSEEVFVKRIPEMTGEMISNSHARPDMYGKPEVILEFTKPGKARFAEVTRVIAEGGRSGRLGRLAIVLDGKLYSAPTVREEINSDSAQITGSFSDREAINLANVLNNPLDIALDVKEQYEVGPTLAADAIVSAKNAFIISTVLTIGFMLVFYTIGGGVAAIGMAVNVLITLGVMASIGATLTMPGIAGIVLTLAMSVDSNILIFERMREELKLGKSLSSALEAGFDKAWSAILDSNVTTLLVALIMIWLGTGPVKGFGVTLAIGIFTTMFAAVVVSKLILEFLIHPGTIKSLKMFSVLQNTSIDFLKYTKAAVIGTVVILLVGIGAVVYKGKEIYGIDFAGGDMVTLNFAKKLEISELRNAATKAGIKEINFSYQQPLGMEREILKITTPFDLGRDSVQKIQQALPEAKFDIAGATRIGASVGEEIQWNALKSVLAALVAILIYVAFRFEMGYGVGAVVATVHDLILTVGLFVLFDRQFNASMVASILLIAGYSINDTIVVFDRIREELKLNPTGTLKDIINRALNLTLSRTIITGGTTLLTAVTLILTTSGDVNDIAFTLLIGVLTGTFSSLFIATPVFFWWHKGDRKHVEAHHDVAPKYEWQGTSKASE
ncbi:protein translocase subunit SecD [Horticoccus sp. 23ND18S-11]|uniref:protein translocase subunit SecD n=1 Tax=Horticoccus sp. 23ND18S-11 TaxID=3391832 RepID=UPI0039C97CB1